MEFLLSGLVGGLIATILSIVYHYIAEQVRRRSNVMMEVVEWADNVYEHLQVMHLQKDYFYNEKTAEELPLTQEEYRNISRKTKGMLTTSKIVTMVALAYGEAGEVKKVNAFQGELLKILQSLYTSEQKTWPELNKNILHIFETIIEPLRTDMSRRFLSGVKITSITGDFLKNRLSIFKKLTGEGKMKKLLSIYGMRIGLIFEILGVVLFGLNALDFPVVGNKWLNIAHNYFGLWWWHRIAWGLILLGFIVQFFSEIFKKHS